MLRNRVFGMVATGIFLVSANAEAQRLSDLLTVGIVEVGFKCEGISLVRRCEDDRVDKVVYWYKSNQFSIGASNNPEKHATLQNYITIQGKNIIGAGIAKDGKAYYWYEDGTVSSGTIGKLTRYRNYYQSNIRKQLIGVAIAGSNDHVYYWYSDGTVSSGTTKNPTKYRIYYSSNLRKTLIGVAISKLTDHVYYWYADGTVSSGTTDNPTRYRNYYESNLLR
jgi:hypothetical protein